MIKHTAKKYYWYTSRIAIMTPYEYKLLEKVLLNKPALKFIKVKRLKAMLHTYKLFNIKE